MGRSGAGKSWTRPADVREAMRRKWPVLLADFLAGQIWEPMAVPLRGPDRRTTAIAAGGRPEDSAKMVSGASVTATACSLNNAAAKS